MPGKIAPAPDRLPVFSGRYSPAGIAGGNAMIELEFNKFSMLSAHWHPKKRKAREGTNKSLAFVMIEGAL